MALFDLRILASDKTLFTGKAQIVIVPAIDGEEAFMAHHENMFMALADGVLRYQKEDGTWEAAITGVGIAQVANNRVTVIVDTAERPEDIDEQRAREALERAQERLRQQQSIVEYHMTQASLARALSRLKNKKKYI